MGGWVEMSRVKSLLNNTSYRSMSLIQIPKFGLLNRYVWVILAICLFSFIYSMNKWENPIKNTLNNDDRLEDLNSIWSCRGLKFWFYHQRLLANLRYRQLKSFIILRIYSSNPTLSKGIVGLSISMIAFTEVSTSKTLTAATVFYATMIFLQSGFEYCALWPRSLTVNRLERPNIMDTVGASTKITNLGTQEARDIEAVLIIKDAVRGLNGTVRADMNERSPTQDRIKPNLSAQYSFTFGGKGDSVVNVQSRASLRGVLGEAGFIVIELHTPDQPVETIQYKSLSEVNKITHPEAKEGFSYLFDHLSNLKEYMEEPPSTVEEDLWEE